MLDAFIGIHFTSCGGSLTWVNNVSLLFNTFALRTQWKVQLLEYEYNYSSVAQCVIWWKASGEKRRVPGAVLCQEGISRLVAGYQYIQGVWPERTYTSMSDIAQRALLCKVCKFSSCSSGTVLFQEKRVSRLAARLISVPPQPPVTEDLWFNSGLWFLPIDSDFFICYSKRKANGFMAIYIVLQSRS